MLNNMASGVAIAALIISLFLLIVFIIGAAFFFIDRAAVTIDNTVNIFNQNTSSGSIDILNNVVWIYNPATNPTTTGNFTLTLNSNAVNTTGALLYVVNATTQTNALNVAVVAGSGLTILNAPSGGVVVLPRSTAVFVFTALNQATFMGYLSQTAT